MNEEVPVLRLHCAAVRAFSLTLVILASVTRRRPASSSSVEAPTPFLSPNPPILCLTPRSISSRFPLRRKSGAHRLEIGPLLLTYLFSEGTYVSTYDVSPLMDPLRHLRLLPSSPAGFRSTFDRLPYGCLLFMYRLDLT